LKRTKLSPGAIGSRHWLHWTIVEEFTISLPSFDLVFVAVQIVPSQLQVFIGPQFRGA